MGKNKIWLFWVSLIVMLSFVLPASAAETGSLKIVDIQGKVALFHVAESDGKLTEAFADAPTEDILEEKAAVRNARALQEYAAANLISGVEAAPNAEGAVLYSPLEEGVYLVCSLYAEPEFEPFLVSIPTKIEGKLIYDVVAQPKLDESDPSTPTDPTDPSDPTDPDSPTDPGTPTGPTEPVDPSSPTTPSDPGPNIPQTGESVIPQYLLLVIGTLVTLAGLYELIAGRKESHE